MTLRKRGISPIARQQKAVAFLFLAPLLVTLTAVAGWPLARTIYFCSVPLVQWGGHCLHPARSVILSHIFWVRG